MLSIKTRHYFTRTTHHGQRVMIWFSGQPQTVMEVTMERTSDKYRSKPNKGMIERKMYRWIEPNYKKKWFQYIDVLE